MSYCFTTLLVSKWNIGAPNGNCCEIGIPIQLKTPIWGS